MSQQKRTMESGRVVALATRTPVSQERRSAAGANVTPGWAPPAREQMSEATRDWVPWLCLGLGILCGAGALYFAFAAVVAR
jgi:hypothetical protein